MKCVGDAKLLLTARCLRRKPANGFHPLPPPYRINFITILGPITLSLLEANNSKLLLTRFRIMQHQLSIIQTERKTKIIVVIVKVEM